MDKKQGTPRNAHRLTVLFFTMLSISAFTFGGGFVIVTLMKRRFVDKLNWIEENEMMDLIALSQTAPGPIAVNAGILVGWKTMGFAGMSVAVLGTVIPPIVILSAISLLYSAFIENRTVATVLSGMQAGVAAVIADVVLGLGQRVVESRDAFQLALMVVAFAAAFWLKINVMAIVLGAALLGAARHLLARKAGRA